MNNKGSSLTPTQALDKLDALYEQSVKALRSAIGKYIETGTLPDVIARHNGLFVYPSLCVTRWHRHQSPENPSLWAFYPCGQLYHYDYPSVAFSSVS